MEEKLLDLLREKDMWTVEISNRLGKYPRKLCNDLAESGVLNKYKKNNRTWYHLEEDDEELDEAVKRAEELIEEEKEGLWSRFVSAIKR